MQREHSWGHISKLMSRESLGFAKRESAAEEDRYGNH